MTTGSYDPRSPAPTQHRFGGPWTQDKLRVLQEYLGFYTQALKNKPFQLIYIDTFAGTGRCQIRVGANGEKVIDGSAKIALDCSPAFDKYHFIERKRDHADELAALIESHPNGSRATLGRQDAAEQLPDLLATYSRRWRTTRGVLFLDPYGLQCTWKMVEQVAATGALDVFFLVSLSGLYRQAALKEKAVDDGKAARLTAFLGTDEWRTTLYTQRQGNLFGDPTVTRIPGYDAILDFTTARLRQVFPYVGEPQLLGRANGAPMFALYFAVANSSNAAIGLARRVSQEILSKLQ